MGAWGYEPFESDQALDWVGDEVTDPFFTALQQAINFDPAEADAKGHQAQAAVFMFVSLIGHPSRVLSIMPGAAITFSKRAITALDVLNRSPWAEEWDDPDAFRAANQRLIEALHKVVEDPDQAIVGTTLFEKILGVVEEPPVPDVDAVWFDTRNGLRARIVADDPDHDEIVAEALDEVGGRATMSRSAFIDFWKPVGPRPTIEAEQV